MRELRLTSEDKTAAASSLKHSTGQNLDGPLFDSSEHYCCYLLLRESFPPVESPTNMQERETPCQIKESNKDGPTDYNETPAKKLYPQNFWAKKMSCRLPAWDA